MEDGWKLVASLEIRHCGCLLTEDFDRFEASIRDSRGSRHLVFADISDALLWLISIQPIYGNVGIPEPRMMDKIKTAAHLTARVLALRARNYDVVIFRRLIGLMTEYVAENQPITPATLEKFRKIADSIPGDGSTFDPGAIDSVITIFWG